MLSDFTIHDLDAQNIFTCSGRSSYCSEATFCLALSFNMQIMKSVTSFEAFLKLFAAGHRSFEMIDISSKFQSLKVLVLAGVQIS